MFSICTVKKIVSISPCFNSPNSEQSKHQTTKMEQARTPIFWQEIIIIRIRLKWKCCRKLPVHSHGMGSIIEREMIGNFLNKVSLLPFTTHRTHPNMRLMLCVSNMLCACVLMLLRFNWMDKLMITTIEDYGYQSETASMESNEFACFSFRF